MLITTESLTRDWNKSFKNIRTCNYTYQLHKQLILLFYIVFLLGDIARIPEMLANAMTEGAGVESDVADEDEEMSSTVKKGKHRRINPGY